MTIAMLIVIAFPAPAKTFSVEKARRNAGRKEKTATAPCLVEGFL
jgi:hypothetical protein